MESPYFTSHWAHPSYRRYFHAPPSQIPTYREKSSPVHKVVEIPVHYVSSNKTNRCDSAAKIQKVFRGYLVRKSVKKIIEIGRDVVEIEKRILKKESEAVIRNDANERLRVYESLMSLLFKLDSVLGVDLCVKELRKRVIKRVIRMQDIVDEIVSSEQNKADLASGEVNEGVKAVEMDTEGAKPEAESNAHVAINEMATTEHRDDVAVSTSEGFDESAGQTESQTDWNPSTKEKEEEEECEEREEVEENKRSREVLERMVEENEKMMELMAELFERNEMQARLLIALTQRVGKLEKAYMCEKSTKKKRNGNGNNKCGGKKEREFFIVL